MEKRIRRRSRSSASPERIAELKKLIQTKRYIDTSIDALSDRMSSSVKINTDKKRSPCYGVNCENCIDRQECNRIIRTEKGRIIDTYV